MQVFERRGLFGNRAGQVDVAENAGEQVIEIMGDAPGKHAERIELCHVLHREFHFLLLGQIKQYAPHSDNTFPVAYPPGNGEDRKSSAAFAGQFVFVGERP